MTIEKILRWVVIGGVFALPFIVLIVASSLFFPYITGKNFYFRGIVEVITGAWLALALVNPVYRPRRSWILGAFSVFVLIIAIADAHGVYPFKSFWSNFERMDGWVTLIHLLMFTVVAASVLNTEKIWRYFWQVSLAVSVYMSGYGLLQVVGITSLGQNGVTGLQGRIDGTLGNPIYLAVYMLFHIFIAAMLWAQSWTERRPGTRLVPSISYGFIIVLDTLTLFLTGTRGTILGLIGGVLIAAVLMVLLARNSRTVWRIAVASVVGILVLSGAFWSIRDAEWIHNIGFLERMATISTSDSTVKARFLNWGIAWEGVKERPVLGWGQENYAIVFDKYYDPRMYSQEQWFDRVHSIIFDWLVAGGFLGLISYLLIFVATLWVLWRSGAFTIAERSILTGLFVAYFVHNLFVFDNVTSYILFGAVLGYMAWRASDKTQAKPIIEAAFLPRGSMPIVAGLCVVAVWGAAWFVNANALAQNHELLAALGRQDALSTNLKDFKQAIAYGSFGTQEAREQLAQSAMQISQSPNIPMDAKQQFLNEAANTLIAQEKASPMDARAPLFLGVMLDAYGDYKDAGTALDLAHTLSPRKQTILFEQGNNAQYRGDNAAALKIFAEAYNLEPEFNDARIYYAAALIRAGDDAKADQLLASKPDQAADARIAQAYIERGRYDKIITIWEARVRSQPDDIQAYYTLAVANYAAGNKQKAIDLLTLIKTKAPGSASQADAVIAQMKAGTFRYK